MTEPHQHRREPESLRSHRWFGVDDLRAFGHRSRTHQMGYDRDDYAGKPVIAILNTWNDLSPCHSHFPSRVAEVKRGVWQAGGFPVELPAMSLSEPFMKPSTMLYRNLLALEAEELLRSYPVDGAATMDLPCVFLPAGPMLRGNVDGQVVGSGSDVWKYWADRRAGVIDACAWRQLEDGIARSAGHCMTMGTASTMTSVAEVLGMTLPGAASIPAADSAHGRMAVACGRLAVDLVWQDRRPSQILSDEAFDDAVTAVLALGGSTNSLIHLIAMARRAGVDLDLGQFDERSRQVPVLANLRPTGAFLMEDFHYAGGLLALLTRIRDLLHLDRPTVTGITFGEALDGVQVRDDDVIRPLTDAVAPDGGLAVLHGTLAPDGAVIKHGAASRDRLAHVGPAVVFDSVQEMHARMADSEGDIDEDHVLVLRNAGPEGGPGMPEWGMLPIPDHLLRRGVRDMVRVSDARMSGTAYGTCVLHVSPEAYVGGPLALVRDGDPIRLDVAGRRLDLLVDDVELTRRQAAWTRPEPRYARGYGALLRHHIGQAHEGCDFDFLQAGAPTPDPEIG